MKDDIIDDFTEEDKGDKRVVVKILLLILVSVLVLLCLFSVKDYFPVFDFNMGREDQDVKVLGLLFFVVYVLISRYLTMLLAKRKYPLKENQLILFGGLIYIVIHLIYVFFQTIIFFQNGFHFDYVLILKLSCTIGLVGMLFVNVSFARRQKKSSLLPGLFAFFVLAIMGYFMNK